MSQFIHDLFATSAGWKLILVGNGIGFLFAVAALAISVWPNIIPPDISFRAASSPPQSQGFTLVGALVVIPLILMYTAWSYYVFRGKVRPQDTGYH